MSHRAAARPALMQGGLQESVPAHRAWERFSWLLDAK